MASKFREKAEARGVLILPGFRDGATDGEHDLIFVRLACGSSKRFHGTLYSDKFVAEIDAWLDQFNASCYEAVVKRIYQGRDKAMFGGS